MKKITEIISAIICIVSLTLIIIISYVEIKEYTNMKNCNASLIQYTKQQLVKEGINTNVEFRKLDHEQLLNINEEFKGWIYNACIDLPLVQATDNYYYLSHDFNKKDSKYGAIFLDHRVDSNDEILLIHGHNTIDGNMFGSLKKYVNEKDYAEVNKKFYVALDTQNYEFEDYTAELFLIVNEKSDLLNPSLYNLEDYKAELLKQSGISATEVFSESNKLIVLSTCYGKAGTDQRLLVVLAKKLNC